MNEYKRLTNKNIDEFNPEYDFCIGCEYFGEPNGCNRQSGSCGNYDQFNELYNRLAELEDKIENGTLVELPCKVGDTLYKICPQGRAIKMSSMWNGRIVTHPCQRCPWQNCQCFDIGYQKDMENIIQPIQMKSIQFIFSIKPYIGKIWFADKEEAEKALAERKEK